MTPVDTSKMYSEIITLLDHSMDDIEAYVPPEVINKMCKKSLAVDTTATIHTKETRSDSKVEQGKKGTIHRHSAVKQGEEASAQHGNIIFVPEKICNLAVDFAINQISRDIENPEVLRIGISGRDAIRVTSQLKNLPQIRKMFDVVVQYKYVSRGNQLVELEEHSKIVSTTRLQKAHRRMTVDLEIRMEDHLLPWKLFCMNVGKVVRSSHIQGVAIDVVERCCGHLLAIVLMGRALKEVNDVSIWKHASHALCVCPTSQMKDSILFNALAFICEQLGSKTNCVKHCALNMDKEGMDKVHLIQRWIKDGLIGTVGEGEVIVEDLLNAFLLESSQNGVSVQMRDEIREELGNLFGPKLNPPVLNLGGKGLTMPPNDEAWEEAGCELFMKVPPEVGELSNLEVLDFEGTEIISLPMDVGKLSKLTFIVGGHLKRIISRLPCETTFEFKKQKRCLKYVNGEDIPVEIKEEIQTLVDGAEINKQEDNARDVNEDTVLGSLQYLSIHYMKNLRSFWKGPVQKGCLSSLNLVTHELPAEEIQCAQLQHLPKLKKISLHYMHELKIWILYLVPVEGATELMNQLQKLVISSALKQERSLLNIQNIALYNDYLVSFEKFHSQNMSGHVFQTSRLKEVAAEVLRIKMEYSEGLNLLSSFPSTLKYIYRTSTRDIEESIAKELDNVGTNWWNAENLEKIVVTSWYMGSKVSQLAVDFEMRMKDHLLLRELFSRNAGAVVHSSSIRHLAIQVLKQCYGHLLATVLIARALKEVKDVRIWEYASQA
ncbi:Disease resistance protein [Vitis vinifera]|uniref:Disease resistance protein n=1 Tax=Vitis vinifera TaxID=29760 RepID=A0A438JA68_VITVI|nr:Disease resistance protein [Vitis vinifera]